MERGQLMATSKNLTIWRHHQITRFDESKRLEFQLTTLFPRRNMANWNESRVEQPDDIGIGEWACHHVAINLGLAVHRRALDGRQIPEQRPREITAISLRLRKPLAPLDGRAGAGSGRCRGWPGRSPGPLSRHSGRHNSHRAQTHTPSKKQHGREHSDSNETAALRAGINAGRSTLPSLSPCAK